MTTFPFSKYQGAGNDFIIIDQREKAYLSKADAQTIEKLCDRRFGIGADGLMFLENDPDYDFRMVYFNSDGRESTMCGNGGRCIVAFAASLGVFEKTCQFIAIDGPHQAVLLETDWVELEMQDVEGFDTHPDGYTLDTGSPHFVQFTNDLTTIEVDEKGRAIRQDARFAPGGLNVNFVEVTNNGLSLATFERGVEAETLACGTGVTAAALMSKWREGITGGFNIPVKAKGGDLEVRFELNDKGAHDIWLCGPAKYVFAGEINLDS